MTGRPRWATRLAECANVNATPLCLDDVVLAASNEGLAFACSAQTGEVIWRTDLGSPCAHPVRAAGGWALFVMQRDLCWVCPATGRIEYRYTAREGMIWSVCCCGDLVLALEHRSHQTCSLLAFREGEVLYERQSPAFTHSYSWSASTGHLYESSARGLAVLNPTTGERLVDLACHLQDGPVHAEGETIYLVLEGPRQPASLCALRHPDMTVPQPGPEVVHLTVHDQMRGLRGYKMDGATVLAVPHRDGTVELVEAPDGPGRWSLPPGDDRFNQLVALNDEETDRLRREVAAAWKPHPLAPRALSTLRHQHVRQEFGMESRWGPDWPEELVELAFPDHMNILRDLGSALKLQPAGMPALTADLERRIRELPSRPIERETDLALFCFLCYEAFACEGTFSHSARDRISRDPYAPGSFHTLPDGTLVQLPRTLTADEGELREVGGPRRRWPFERESGFQRTDLTPCSEEMVGLKLQSLSFDDTETEALAWANRLLERLRSQPPDSGQKDACGCAAWAPRPFDQGDAAQLLAQLAGPITPDHPELQRIVQALILTGFHADPTGDFKRFAEIWVDYGLMRWARKSGYL